MILPFPIRPKVTGSGRITYRCAVCRRPIETEPVMAHHDGKPVALHAGCHQKEK